VASYGRQDITTDRVVGADHAQFNANSYSGRIESGIRGAGQGTRFAVPCIDGRRRRANTFALAYAGKTVTSTAANWLAS
jgi:hypothetical protein